MSPDTCKGASRLLIGFAIVEPARRSSKVGPAARIDHRGANQLRGDLRGVCVLDDRIRPIGIVR